MADKLEITSNAAKLLRRFERLPNEVRTGVRTGLARGLILVEQQVQTKSEVKARHGSGGLMGRLTSFVRVESKIGIDGIIGFRKTRGFPYELSQEYGARAKPGGAMAIPVTPEARRAGSPRSFGKDLFIPRGTHVLAEKKGRGGFRTHYVLVKSIPARLNFRDTVTGSGGIISAEVVRELKDVA